MGPDEGIGDTTGQGRRSHRESFGSTAGVVGDALVVEERAFALACSEPFKTVCQPIGVMVELVSESGDRALLQQPGAAGGVAGACEVPGRRGQDNRDREGGGGDGGGSIRFHDPPSPQA